MTVSKFLRLCKSSWFILVSFTSIALLLLLSGWLLASFTATEELERSVEKLDLSDKKKNGLREAAAKVFEIQSARRGYVLTGNQQFQDAFDHSARQLKDQLGVIHRDSVSPDGARDDVALIAESLVVLAAQYENQLQASMELRRLFPEAIKEQQRATLEGDALGRTIHGHLANLQQAIDRDFAKDLRMLLGKTQEIERSQAWLAFAGVLVLLTGYAAVVQSSVRNFQTRKSLADTNAALEQKIEGRTTALMASELRYRQLVEFAGVAILLCDASRAVIYLNPAARTLSESVGTGGLEGIRIDSLMITDPRTSGDLEKWFDGLWHSPTQSDFGDAFVVGKSGGTVPVELGAVSYLDHGAMHVQIILHDMTRLRAGESEVKSQLRFIDQLFEAIPIPLSVRDERSCYLRANGAYKNAYGCKDIDIRHRSVFDVLPYELAIRIARNDQLAMQQQDPHEYDNTVATIGGREGRYLSRASAVRRQDGSVIGVIAADSDVTEIRLKEDQMRQINSELEGLSQQLLVSQESERRRISRDLHDQVGQILTALKISLQTSVARLPDAPDIFARALSLADEAIMQTRTLTASLHPHILEDLGLSAAIRWQVEKFVQPSFKNIKLSIDLSPSRGRSSSELVAFRVVQEALTNVIRHANASHLKVSLKTRGGSLHIAVTDDGNGIDHVESRFDTARPSSLGIASMRERVAELGGKFALERGSSRGTVVRAVMPW